MSIHLFEEFIYREYVYRGQAGLFNTTKLSVQDQKFTDTRYIYIFPLWLKINTQVPVELIEYAINLQTSQIKKW